MQRAIVILMLGLTAACRIDAGQKPFGIEKRVPWTTSRVKGTPDPPLPYRTERVFPALRFAEPLALATAPGTGRLFLVERYGKIFSFPDAPATGRADLLVDLGRTAYGLAFHPDFERNRFVYITTVLDPDKAEPRGSRVSQFVVSRDDPPRCDPRSEKVLIEWPSGGHNGGCLRFGPDGFLYIVTGDASEIADGKVTGQDVGDLAASVLRIDVDRPGGGRAYGIPPDNPFVDLEGARPEVWAYGLRQLWKMSFDRKTGDLWGGTVGQDLWEMVHRIESGGNYGWSVTEGSHPFLPQRERGPTPILPPVLEYDHTQGRSITGGFVYRGSRLQDLVGTYIYGDYDTGRIWGLRYDGERVVSNEELVDTSLRLVAFGETRCGELYLVDHAGGGIHRLVKSPPARDLPQFPRRLSETGLFTSTRNHTLAPGVIPFSVSARVWSDGASKDRFLALPGTSRIELDVVTYPQPAPGAPPGWKFPDGTVVVETISLEMETGNPTSHRRLETRILHHERLAGPEDFGNEYWNGYTYIWNDEQTDAVLLEERGGLDRAFTIRDRAAPGGTRSQTWHFPSRAECTVCHNMAAKFLIGVNTLQMNRDHDYGGVVDNQLRTLEHIGVFTKPLPARPRELPRLVDWADQTQSLDHRARSYLHGNCGHCHRKWGGGNAAFQLLYPLGLADTGIAGVQPAHGTFQIASAAILTPGDPYRSVLFYRLAKVGPGRMPRLGSHVIHQEGLRLIHGWIAGLPASADGGALPESVVRSRAEDTTALRRLRAGDTAADARAGAIDRLLASTSGALRLVQAIDGGSLARSVRDGVIARATGHGESHVRDLFERFLPEERRTKRLGNVISPAAILALEGDVARGRATFFDTEGVQCKNCHRIAGKGGEVGPELGEIGKKYDRAKLLESILEPSREIDPKFAAHLLETTSGEVRTGLVIERTAGHVVLRDAASKSIRVPTAQIKLLVPLSQSLMPDLLLRDMTAGQVADLVAFLASMK